MYALPEAATVTANVLRRISPPGQIGAGAAASRKRIIACRRRAGARCLAEKL